ncbi:MAG: helix-turn-helix domain-containing protein [Ruminococcus sp.]|nr:helix-turn-helix domain-containing protein [Ruminococcus sp.]
MVNTSFLAIPYDIFNLEGLTLSAKVLLAEIFSLSKLEGYCYASNEYLAERLNVSSKTVKNSLRQLKSCNYITIKLAKGSERSIYPNPSKIFTSAGKNLHTAEGKKGTGSRAKITHNNIIYNTNYNNNYKEHRFNSNTTDASYDLAELEKIV